MKSQILQLAAYVFFLSAMSVSAAIRYVNVNSASPASPYTNWTTAATTIQDAVDAAAAADQILVTNGVYQTGGRAAVGTTNRVAVNKPVTVQSVNGATGTVIQGFQVPDTTYGDSAIRCVYLTNGAALVGFTLTNGATRTSGDALREQSGGGVWCESTNAVVSNCVLTGNSGGGASSGTLSNCVLTGNSAGVGGGAYEGVLNNCTLTGNSAYVGGGGAFLCTLNNCTLTTNSAEEFGGGAMSCTLNNCVLTGNSAYFGFGGGASRGTLNTCTLSGNSARHGGGASGATLNNCALTGNSAAFYGGGAEGCTLYNCTLTANSASRGGGASGGALLNCIVYYNSASIGANYSEDSFLSDSCTTPLPSEGEGNISADPQLTSASHLSASSPCRGAGSAANATGLDIDRESWTNPPSIGCDEYHPGTVTGPLSVSIHAAYTNVAVGFTVNFTAAIGGRATSNRWEFGDGTVVSNQPFPSHSWAAAGDYPTLLHAYNETYPGGVRAAVTVHVVAQPIHYVALGSANPVPPYTSWVSAATNIQAAVDAASVAGALVLVTNGVYQTGGRVVFGTMTNRVAVNKPVTVRSVNGAAVTVIRGFQVPGTVSGDSAIRCVYLTNGAALVGFTLTNGATRSSGDDLREQSGGGVWCESASAMVSNCVLAGNSAGDGGGGGANGGTLNNCMLSGNSAGESGGGAASCTLNNCVLTGNSASYGGGASRCTLNNCALSGNWAGNQGGGAISCTLNNCTLSGNLARESGGGAYDCMLNNCIVYYNSARIGDNYSPNTSFSYSCTTPVPTDGLGNLANAPLFMNQAGGNLRLQSNSPCINAGSNASAPPGPDLDGNSRIIGGTVDIGAYEFQAPQSFGSIHYVDVNSANPTPPYNNWTTAATTIQDAVDAAVAGDQILVTNGVYQTGGRVVFGEMTNRVAVHKPVTVQSVNGAAVTVIRGFQVPDTTNGEGAIRCVYLTNGASLVGFTLTNGATRVSGELDLRELSGGGVWCDSTNAVVSNCVLTGNSAGYGGGAVNCRLTNCVLTGNSAGYGGGALYCTLNNCTLTANSAGESGGGAASCTLNNCVLTGNSAYFGWGGGAGQCTLNNCTLTGNSARAWGGGAASCTLTNCTLTGNSVDHFGGGAEGCTLNNCTLTGNSAYDEGGGAHNSTLFNCTLTANSASRGGGASGGALLNCIVYYNSASNGANYLDSFLSYSCTTPLPPEGEGNIRAEPQLASASHLSAGSPCRGAGSAAYAAGLDIDGESWANPPSIGCDEYHPGTVTGPLSVSIHAAYTNVAVGFTVNFAVAIDGRATSNRWEFGDGTVVSNQPFPSHSWAAAGAYSVVLRAYNDTYPGGISAMVTVHVVAQPVHYVALGSPNPVAPYTIWATAATNIQDAVDAVSAAGALVLVTNGVYQTGGRVVFGTMTNRVAVNKPSTVQSVNGAAVTVIRGFQVPGTVNGDSAIRCVYLTKGAALVGFTLTNGATQSRDNGDLREQSGGGVWCESAGAMVSKCVLTGNSAYSTGGGVNGGTLNDCTLSGNSVSPNGGGGGANVCALNNCTLSGNSALLGAGGGANRCTLNNCTLTGNCASYGSGAHGCTLNNCIVYYNTACDGNNYSESLLSYSCTTPLPKSGIGNLTNAPLFVDYAGVNLRLHSNSPCINAGSNASAPPDPDLDGNPRIAGGSVDLGAYEFQSPQSLISYEWLQKYSLPTDGSADVTDADADGLNNWQEWRTGTNPTNAVSVLRLLSPASGGPGLIVSWQSVGGLTYFLERGTDLGAQLPLLPLATNIVGQPGTTTFTDTNGVGAGPFFYRVGVQEWPTMRR